MSEKVNPYNNAKMESWGEPHGYFIFLLVS